MTNLIDALNRMEHRLQQLVEGSLARFFAPEQIVESFSHRLVRALREQVNFDKEGRFRVPGTIVLNTTPELGEYLRMHPALLEELNDQIESAARDAGIYFAEPPDITVKSDPAQENGKIDFSFEPLDPSPGTTDVLPVAPGEHSLSYPTNAYLIISGNQIVNLTRPVTNLGRRVDNHIVLDDRRVSRLHAQIRISQGKFILFDLQSRGGTFVNGERIHQQTLHPGDVISLAGVLLVFGQETFHDLGKTQEYRPELPEP
jgi:hypothetical protein